MNISLESVLQSCHLVQVESCIQKPVLNRESVLAVFLDIEKPYDMIWRRRLFIKMQNIGIGVKKMLGWVKSFFLRQLYVCELVRPTQIQWILRLVLLRVL